MDLVSKNTNGPITIEILPGEAQAIQMSMLVFMEVMAQSGEFPVHMKLNLSRIAVKLITGMLEQTTVGNSPDPQTLEYLDELKQAVKEMEETGEHPVMKADSVVLRDDVKKKELWL